MTITALLRASAFALLFLACAIPAAAYDLTRYDLLIEPDIAARRVRVTATLTIDNPELETEFAFGLHQGYASPHVEYNGRGAEVDHANGIVTVRTSTPARETRLVFSLEGATGKSGDDPRDVITDTSVFLLWSDRFYPIAFDDWAIVRTTVVLPPGFDVIAPGRRVAIEPRGAARAHVFETMYPTVCVSVIASSTWTRSERTIGGREYTTLLDPESAGYAEQIFRTSSEIVSFFAELHGGYPFDGFAFVTIPGIYARRAFPGFVGYSPAYLAKEMERTGHDAHETSLLWWGYTTRGSGPASFQWTEGFGDYVELLYDETAGHPVPQNFRHFRKKYLERDPATEPHYTALRGNMQDIIHGKLPWLVDLVRQESGDAKFRDALRLLFTRYRHRTFTLDEFVATMEEGSGVSLARWRKEWLERAGVPAWSARVDVADNGGSWTTKVTIAQRGEEYDVPLDVALDAEVRRVERVRVKGAGATAVFTTAEKPRAVTLDPREALLFRVTWENPEQPMELRPAVNW